VNHPWDGPLADLGCAAALVVADSARDPDLAHFVGAAHLGQALLVLPAGGAPRLGYFSAMERDEAVATGLELAAPADLGLPRMRREGWPEPLTVAAAAGAALAACGLRPPARLALAGHPAAGVAVEAARQLERDGWAAVAGDGLLRRLRKRKGAAQAAAVRRAAAGAGAALRAVAATLATARVGRGGELSARGGRLTVGRLRAVVARALAERGLGQPAGNIVAPGAEAGVPHSPGDDDRVLRAGEALVVDLYPWSAPCFADASRTFCVGAPPEPLAAAHAAVREALELAGSQAVAGARGWDLQLAVCALFERRGYPTVASAPETEVGYVHDLGHGVGCELHEHPSFRRRAGGEGVLEVGDAFTLEPGLYDPEGGWGVRLEDTLLLGEEGLENLTPLPYDLDPRSWVG